MDVQIVAAAPAEAGSLGGLIAEAFADLPPSRWLVGDPDQWSKIGPEYFGMFVAHALAGHGTVYTTEDRAAVAVWFDNTGQPPQPPASYEARLPQICGAFTARFLAFDEAMEHTHPTAPHHHLAFLAVRPDRQRGGLGSALLRRHHAWLDEHGTAGYLEAATLSLCDLYAAHGYQPLGEPVAPLGDPLMWPMWRAPGNTSTG